MCPSQGRSPSKIGAPGVTKYLQDTAGGILNCLPQLIGALVIPIIGWIVGRLLGGAVRRLADGRTSIGSL